MPTVSLEEEAARAFLELSRRGDCELHTGDAELLTRPLGSEQLQWAGGVREENDGQLFVVAGVTSSSLTEKQSGRLGQLAASAYRGFFKAGANGFPLTDVARIRDVFGNTLEENYPEANEEFLRLAKTYWTFKALLRQLQREGCSVVVRSAMEWVDDLIANLFFPYDGPLVIDPSRREHDQRRFLREFAPEMDVDAFIRGNPILIRDRKRFRSS